MKKRKIPDGVVAIETYRWDFERGDYVLVKREPVKKEDGKKEDAKPGDAIGSSAK